jgi:predicted HTH transcriptional regulator
MLVCAVGGHDAGDTVNDTVNPRNDTVFLLIREMPDITAAKIAEKTGLGIATVKREIKRLKECGAIERVGSDKTGCWKVLKVSEER